MPLAKAERPKDQKATTDQTRGEKSPATYELLPIARRCIAFIEDVA